MTKLTLTALLGALTLSSGTAYAQACGDVLTVDTTLTADLTCTGPGLTVAADNIVLDCDGYAIQGAGSDVGIFLDGTTGVTVKNCMVADFAVGISLFDAPANYLARNGVSGSTSMGSGAIQLNSGSDGNVLRHNRSYANAGRGFAIIDSVSNLVIENGAFANAFRGIDVIDASNNAVIGNYVSANTSGGIVVSGTSTANIFNKNNVSDSGSEGFAVFSAGNFLSFNTSDTNGTWGINDSAGGASFYLNNQCSGNGFGPSNLTGLCL